MPPDHQLSRILCPRCGNLTLNTDCMGCGWLRPAHGLHVRAFANERLRWAGDITTSGDLLLVAAQDGTLHAFDRFTLAVRGRFRPRLAGASGELEAAIAARQVAADAAHLYVAANHDRQLGRGAATLFALRRDTMAVAWQCTTDSLQISAPTLYKGIVYFTARNGKAWAVEAASGSVLPWGPLIDHWSPAAPAVCDDLVIPPARSPHIVALDRHKQDRRVRWSFSASDPQAWLNLSPLLIEDRVCVAGSTGALHILDQSTGRLIGSYSGSQGASFLTDPVGAHTGSEWLVLAGAKDHCLHAVGLDGTVRWAKQCKGSIYSRPLLLDNEVYVANHAGVLYAFALESGDAFAAPLELGEPVEAALAGDGVHVVAAGRRGSLWQIVPNRRPLREAAEHLARHEMSQAVETMALAGRLEEAADLCAAHLGQFAAAAQLHKAAGQDQAALDLYVQAGDSAAAERLRADTGLHYTEPAQAAAMLEHAGSFARAAEVWLEANMPQAAIACWLRDGSAPALQAALTLSRQQADWRSEVRALAALGRNQEAGDLALRHAQQDEEATRGQDADSLAESYALALACFAAAGTPHAAEWVGRCRDKVRFYWRLPNLRVELLTAASPYSVNQTHPLHVRLTNEGPGQAYNIRIQLSAALGLLQGKLIDEQAQLAGYGGEWRPNLDIVPAREGRIRLDCLVVYADQRGSPLEDRYAWSIEVKGRHESGQQTIVVQAGGQLVQSNGGEITVVGGDYVGDHGQKGDRVTINRATPREGQLGFSTTTDATACQHCGARLAAGAGYCDQCGQKINGERGEQA